ncbi:MAG TPA: ABC transporter substrate-binding protein, partial [Candidatus Cloacimonadota bacterium]|nr:ABC transporter substrate-binding protein [Candidatus Cloacimonadota bacterium]
MKNIFILTLLLTILLGCQCRTESVPDFHADTLRVYATEVFLNDDFYDEVFPIFQNIFHCHVQTTVFQDGFALLDTIRQNDSLDIDIVFGFDNVILNEIRGDSLFIPYEAQNLRFVKKDWQIDPTFQMTPVSHTQIGFIYDSYSIGNAPSTFGEMQDGILKDKIIIINPNTSSLGRAMLIWSVAAFGENGYSHFWRSVKANIYKITDNYDDA